MHLTYLRLRNFRSYTQLNLQLHPRLNVFVGDNAQGKTNIIEAIYLLSENHSFRTSTVGDLIQWGAETAIAETELVRDDLKDIVTAEIGPNGKHFFRNGKKCRGVPELTTVLFAPEALRLTKEGPSERREFLDHVLGQLYPTYRPTLRKYQQALVQHNRLLQNEELFGEALDRQLDGWKTQLIEYGSELSALRSQGIVAINHYLPEAYAAIAGVGASLLLRYTPRNPPSPRGEGWGEGEAQSPWRDCLAVAFRERADDERRRRVTLVGPHRDDFSAFIGGREVRYFASQGEHRSCVLALKRCEILLLREAYGHSPILLLDDVASELDPDRNHAFFSHLLETEGQVLVSAVSRETVSLPENQNSRWFAVSSGNVENL
jgi:DNA replication and repair protein RecF